MRAATTLAFTALAVLTLAACQKETAPPPKDAGLKVAPPTAAPSTPPSPAPTIAPAPVFGPAPPPPSLPAAPSAVPAAPAPPAPPAPVVAPRPPAPSSFDGAFNLVGTEPFWNMTIRPGGLTLTRPDHADLTAANPGFTELGKSALWTATADKSRLTVTLTKASCSDGMSDRRYAYAAKVSLWGATLSGCALKVKG